MIKKYSKFIGHNIILTCTDGDIIEGYWDDIFYAEDDDDQEEDEILLECSNGAFQIAESEIASIQLDE